MNTEQVRWDFGSYMDWRREERNAEFDRWLAEHDAEVAKKAIMDMADVLKPHGPIRSFLANESGPSVNSDWIRKYAESIT